MIISKMILSRITIKTDKNWAIFTALFLIFIAFVIARLLPLLIPQEAKYLEFIINGFFVLFSWDMVNAMVGGAIDQAVESANQQNIDNLKAKTPEESHKKQDLEFMAWVTSKNIKGRNSLLQNDNELEIIKTKALIRDEIVNVLTKNQDNLLTSIATKASRYTLNKEKLTHEEQLKDIDLHELEIFRQDIFIYLKAWLVISIKYDREMQSELIKQSHPSEESPKKQDYLKALRYIKDNLMERDTVAQYFQEKYKHEAREIIKFYLNRLIERIKKEP
ncbi:hypothetical protein [Nostoc sp. NZL]|uniref:hypothetical protein n=1 Tax=Nostoc sp. NZL TaxID=2650612 RepID=UPI0018C662FF|nr:hypothetical protein [Nostoc sp. NZL]MBG1242569.1 hypothetical protein [Nostoc sp. NZL]MBG1243035.1 hypothetical protein [Nostoc sp. NZL]